MIAFIQARFPAGAPDFWSDAVIRNWMDPKVEFSLVHFWKQSTFGEVVDLSYRTFPPVVLSDPRTSPLSEKNKELLVTATMNAVDALFRPDWNSFDRVIIFFSHRIEALFGGGPFLAPNGKLLPAAVFDVDSRFDHVCQEVGHTLGLDHELSRSGEEYGCPYSVMSAAGDLTFARTPSPTLPGNPPAGPQQCTIGPYLPAVHLYINDHRAVNPRAAFNNPDSVKYVSVDYEHSPYTFRLEARDVAIAAWPRRRPVLAVVPPIVPGGDTHFLELRRVAGYDSGIKNPVLTIFSANFFEGNHAVADNAAVRIRYLDSIVLNAASGDRDYHSYSGRFVVRVNSLAADFSTVELTVAGGDAWRAGSITLDNVTKEAEERSSSGNSAWRSTLAAPCPIWPEQEYTYRYNWYTTTVTYQAHSTGYEKPGYIWYLDNIRLTGTKGVVTVNTVCRDYNGPDLDPPALRAISCQFDISAGRIELTIPDPYAEIHLDLRADVAETSPEVLKNLYPDRTAHTAISIENVERQWDSAYETAFDDCRNALEAARHKLIPKRIPKRWDGVQKLRDLVHDLAERVRGRHR